MCSALKVVEAERKSYVGVCRESRLEYLVINLDDGCACLYLLHSINPLLSLLHPVRGTGADFCTKFPPDCAGIQNPPQKNSRTILITHLQVILYLKKVMSNLFRKEGGHNNHDNDGWVLLILKSVGLELEPSGHGFLFVFFL